MSVTEDYSTDLGVLRKTVSDLTMQVDAFTRKKQRKQKITAVLGALLVVISAFSLSGLTSMTRKLDAEAVAQISRQHLEARLPDARMKVQTYLEAEAPNIVANAFRSMLDHLPAVRTVLFRGLMTSFDDLNFQFEKNTIEAMSVLVSDSKEKIDEAYPNGTDREKVERLIDSIAASFKTTIRQSTEALYPDYQSEMNRVISHLDMLQFTDAAKLSEEHRIHRQIVQTLLQLLERRQTELETEQNATDRQEEGDGTDQHEGTPVTGRPTQKKVTDLPTQKKVTDRPTQKKAAGRPVLKKATGHPAPGQKSATGRPAEKSATGR